MQRCPNCGHVDRSAGADTYTVTTVRKGHSVGQSAPVTSMSTEWLVPGGSIHLNNTLPPVDCPLLIKIPAGVLFSHFEGGVTWKLDIPVLLKVRRRHWEQSKEATPTYYDEYGNAIIGKFEWTYP